MTEQQMRAGAARLLVLSKSRLTRVQVSKTTGISQSAVRRMVHAKLAMIEAQAMPTGDWLTDRETAQQLMEKHHGT